MNTVLWIVEALLAGVFTLAGGVKLLVPRETLQKKMHWAPSWPRSRIKLLGLAEVLGAMALVLPGATGVAPVLTPVAAVCLAILMAGAIATHRRL
ncbi:MAG TPA: DoxX family protein, partial [Myxococcaceae bacterium]|nr:DoxX family protein [Myxococcaceae bacterium]